MVGGVFVRRTGALVKKSVITSGGASYLEGLIGTPTGGVALLTRQKCPKATWGKPQDPDAPERPPGRSNDLPERRLNGAYKVQRAHLPHRLAVPEKIFALLACSIFSTATGAPPRCIRHWRRSAPHPAHRDPFPGPGLLGYPSYLLHRSVSSAVTSGRWAFRSHICKSGAICARQPAAARPGRLYISRSAGFASSSASVSSRAV